MAQFGQHGSDGLDGTVRPGAQKAQIRALKCRPSSRANLDREETRADFPYGFRGFAAVRRTTRRARRAKRAALSAPVSDLDFRGERLRRPSGSRS